MRCQEQESHLPHPSDGRARTQPQPLPDSGKIQESPEPDLNSPTAGQTWLLYAYFTELLVWRCRTLLVRL